MYLQVKGKIKKETLWQVKTKIFKKTLDKQKTKCYNNNIVNNKTFFKKGGINYGKQDD